MASIKQTIHYKAFLKYAESITASLAQVKKLADITALNAQFVRLNTYLSDPPTANGLDKKMCEALVNGLNTLLKTFYKTLVRIKLLPDQYHPKLNYAEGMTGYVMVMLQTLSLFYRIETIRLNYVQPTPKNYQIPDDFYTFYARTLARHSCYHLGVLIQSMAQALRAVNIEKKATSLEKAILYKERFNLHQIRSHLRQLSTIVTFLHEKYKSMLRRSNGKNKLNRSLFQCMLLEVLYTGLSAKTIIQYLVIIERQPLNYQVTDEDDSIHTKCLIFASSIIENVDSMLNHQYSPDFLLGNTICDDNKQQPYHATSAQETHCNEDTSHYSVTAHWKNMHQMHDDFHLKMHSCSIEQLPYYQNLYDDKRDETLKSAFISALRQSKVNNLSPLEAFLKKTPTHYIPRLHYYIAGFYESLENAMPHSGVPTDSIISNAIEYIISDFSHDDRPDWLAVVKLWKKYLPKSVPTTRSLFEDPIITGVYYIELTTTPHGTKQTLSAIYTFYGISIPKIRSSDLYREDKFRCYKSTLEANQRFKDLRKHLARTPSLPISAEQKRYTKEASKRAQQQAMRQFRQLIEEEQSRLDSLRKAVNCDRFTQALETAIKDLGEKQTVITTIPKNIWLDRITAKWHVDHQLALLDKRSAGHSTYFLIEKYKTLWRYFIKTECKHRSCMKVAQDLMGLYLREVTDTTGLTHTGKISLNNLKTLRKKIRTLKNQVSIHPHIKSGFSNYLTFSLFYMQAEIIRFDALATVQTQDKSALNKDRNNLRKFCVQLSKEISAYKGTIDQSLVNAFKQMKRVICPGRNQSKSKMHQHTPYRNETMMNSMARVPQGKIGKEEKQHPPAIASSPCTNEHITTLMTYWYSQPQHVYSEHARQHIKAICKHYQVPYHSTAHQSESTLLTAVDYNQHIYTLQIILANSNNTYEHELANELMASLRIDASIVGKTVNLVLEQLCSIVRDFKKTHPDFKDIKLVLFGSQAEKAYHCLKPHANPSNDQDNKYTGDSQSSPASDIDILLYAQPEQRFECAMLFSKVADAALNKAGYCNAGDLLKTYRVVGEKHTYHNISLQVNDITVALDISIGEKPLQVFLHSTHLQLVPDARLSIYKPKNKPQVIILEEWLSHNRFDLRPDIDTSDMEIILFIIRKASDYTQYKYLGPEITNFLNQLFSDGPRLLAVMKAFHKRYLHKVDHQASYSRLMHQKWPYQGGYITIEAILNSCRRQTGNRYAEQTNQRQKSGSTSYQIQSQDCVPSHRTMRIPDAKIQPRL